MTIDADKALKHLCSILKAEPPDAERQAELVRHIQECDDCRFLICELALCVDDPVSDEAQWTAERASRVHARLMKRIAEERDEGRHRGEKPLDVGPPRFAAPAAGWLVAASMSALLLTHHTFHQTLDFGWVVASIFAFACVLLLIDRTRVARRIRDAASIAT